MSLKPGWQQPGIVPKRACPHLTLIFAVMTLSQHPEGHEWVCTCGDKFVVVSNAGQGKRLVSKRDS